MMISGEAEWRLGGKRGMMVRMNWFQIFADCLHAKMSLAFESEEVRKGIQRNVYMHLALVHMHMYVHNNASR